MKKTLLVIMGAFVFMMVSPIMVMADEDKVDHYEGKDFANKKEAIKALIETSQKMAGLAADAELDVPKMEAIHETSYTTENAVAYLNKKSKLNDLAEKLEEVHLSSEGHDADEVRRNFIAYQVELIDYLDH